MKNQNKLEIKLNKKEIRIIQVDNFRKSVNCIQTSICDSHFRKGVFSDDLRLEDITPIFKKEENLNKERYRPVSILPYLSKESVTKPQCS